MNLQALTETLKRLETLVALAGAKAAQGVRALFLLLNRVTFVNLAPLGAAVTVAAQTGNLTVNRTIGPAGSVRVIASMTVAPGTSAAGEVVQFSLMVDGAPTLVIGQTEISATHTIASGALVGTFTALAAGNHTFGIQATNVTNGAHTLQVTAAGLASVDAQQVG